MNPIPLMIRESEALPGVSKNTELQHNFSRRPSGSSALRPNLIKKQMSELDQNADITNRAAAALIAKDYPNAVSLFKIAESAYPNSVDVKYGLAASLALTNRLDEALQTLEMFSTLEPPQSTLLKLQQEILSVTPPPELRIWSLSRVITAEEFLCKHPDAGEKTSISIGGGRVKETTLSYYQLKNISILGIKALLVTRDEAILRESTPDANIETAIHPVELRRARPGKEVFRPGEFVVLYCNDAHGFYHWFMEQLPKVILAEKLGFTGTYVISEGVSFQTQSLELLGIAPDRIKQWDGLDWRAEHLWVMEAFPGYRQLQHPGITALLRSELLKTITVTSPDQRIYSTRTNPNRPRRVVNEENLVETLRKYDFTTVDFATLSVKQQIELAASTNALVGPHGAGIIHSLFMPEESMLIELVAPTYINPVGIIPASFLRHRYHIVPSYLADGTYAFGQDIEAFTLVVDLILKNEFESRRGKNLPDPLTSLL